MTAMHWHCSTELSVNDSVQCLQAMCYVELNLHNKVIFTSDNFFISRYYYHLLDQTLL